MSIEASPSSRPFIPAIADPDKLVIGAFSATLFASAFLIFWIEPYFARLLLPKLGGSQGVWATCLVFFQGSLLAGYAYAHMLARIRSVRTQMLCHAFVLVIGILFIPIVLPHDWAPAAGGSPVAELFAVLIGVLGWPFCALSANAPLLQHWFSLSRSASARNPYFLYAASNLGSLAALLAFPFLLEPDLTLSMQSRAWGFGYLALMALGALCAFLTLGFAGPSADVARAPAQGHSPWTTRLSWVGYAALPSSLLLGVTGYLTTDVASFPLLWIAPLAIYLLSFVLTFAARPPIPHSWMRRGLPLAVILAAIGFWLGPFSLVAAVAAHLLAFFVVAMAWNGELAASRPAPEQLTDFYLWMSVGGVIGGAATALLSPLLFHSIIEYPLVLGLACLLVPAGSSASWWKPAIALAAVILTVLVEPLAPYSWKASAYLSVWLIALVACVGMRPGKFQPLLAALAFVLASQTAHTLFTRHGSVIWRDRSFYGAYIVTEDKQAGYRIMFHGTTLHGVERIHGAPAPLSYYAAQGPLGDVMGALEPRLHAIGAVGLGIGSEACFARPGQSWTFYELDGLVYDLAAKDGLFRTLTTCAPQAKVVLGDGRLNLERSVAQRYDLLILDAFSSDAIPVHLLTREAFASYLRVLKPDGVIAIHVTNRFFDLAPVIARLGDNAGLTVYDRNFTPPKSADMALLAPSHWVVLAREPGAISKIARDPSWRRLRANRSARLWTDDYSNVLAALK